MDTENKIPVGPEGRTIVKRKSRINRQELTPEEVGQIQRQRRSEINKKYYNRNSGKLRERERKRYKINKDINQQKEQLINEIYKLLQQSTEQGIQQTCRRQEVDTADVKLKIEKLKETKDVLSHLYTDYEGSDIL